MKLEQTSNLTQIDERFWNIPPFTGLKLFRHYSQVIQWSGNEQKAMIKQLIVVATPLLIQDIPETIYCTCAILDFTMLALYPLYNDEKLFYIDYTLYKLDKTKIAFENHYPINAKLFRPTLNYQKFHIITHFVKSIQDYGSTINYDTPDVEVMHVCSATNVLLKYNWHLDPTDNEAAVDLGLQNVKKY